MTDDVILQTKNLSKQFKGLLAVDDVNLEVRRGTIHGLIGPNGAGKTTVFNLLTRILKPSGGRILFNGRDITRAKPAEVARSGMVRSFQISATFPHLSALENVRIGLQQEAGGSFHFWRSERSLDRLNARAIELLASVGLEDAAHAPAAELPYGMKRALEIATTLALDPELMLLDEPTQGMGHDDVGRVSDLIRHAATDRTVLMVEHNLGVVADLCERITVLQRGAILAEGSYDEMAANPAVREAYMGAEA
jgi:branched-chain amino acid transport system ATP-binding protein